MTTTTIETFSSQDIQELKKQADTQNPIKAMKRWANHQYAIQHTNRFISNVEIKDGFVGEITIVER